IGKVLGEPIQLQVKMSISDTTPVRPLFGKDAKWFVYPRWIDEVWTYDGGDHLIAVRFQGPHHLLRDDPSMAWHQVFPENESIKTLPEAVKARLPKEFLDKFKDK